MTTPKFLPIRPSLESIRKQAKKLARDVAAGNADAVARARAQLPSAQLPLSQRDAQRVLAREYGFAGWQDLREEVLKRMGKGLEWASVQAARAIHDNDIERLKELLAECPALLSWHDDYGGTLLNATTSYAIDSRDPAREQWYNRPACAEFLIDAGAVIEPSVWEHIIGTGAAGMLQLLWSKGVLPRTLPILAALGDLDAVRACLEQFGASGGRPGNAGERATVNKAFMNACRFKHKAVASMLLDRCIELDDELGKRINGTTDRSAFTERLGPPLDLGSDSPDTAPITPWQAFVMRQLTSAIRENDLPAFIHGLQSESYLLEESCVGFQVKLLEDAVWNNRGPFIARLLDLGPAVLQRRTPPLSSAIGFALDYGNAHLVPLLTRIWPLPDDLPHVAGVGDLARVKRWFDEAGKPALGDLNNHYPVNNLQRRADLHWGAGNVQQILAVALAWACMNKRLEIASFLLEHGADINTNWSTHEPASILHECAMHNNYEAARFLIEHGIDMTIRDYRYHSTAEGWARYAAKNEEMAEFLAAAERQR